MSNLMSQVAKKMTSREISSITGKEHRSVLRDIDVLDKSYQKLGMPKLVQGYYSHPNTGKQLHRCFDLTKMQTFDLLTGYSTEMRIKVNRRWEELERGDAKRVVKSLPPRRKHNRLTVTRLNEIMRYVCMIEDASLRLTITDKLYENN